jgi:hypothetical protein
MITQNGLEIHAIRCSSSVTPADDHAYSKIDEVTKRWLERRLRGALFIERSLPMTTATTGGQTEPINGMQMYYEINGQGEPLVLLHGFKAEIAG